MLRRKLGTSHPRASVLLVKYGNTDAAANPCISLLLQDHWREYEQTLHQSAKERKMESLEVIDAQCLNSWGRDCESTLCYIHYHTILQQIWCFSGYHAN